MMTSTPQDQLHDLASRAGIALRWEDFRGRHHEVGDDTLRHLLAALELPCDSAGQLADSRARLEAAMQPRAWPPLITATCGEPTVLPGAPADAAFALELESGGRHDGRLHAHDGRVVLPAIETPGYHRLQVGDIETTLAVAPECCFGVHDPGGARGGRPWALAAQLYGLRMPGDGGLGTYAALAHLAARLGRDGAAALAVSPAHAMFSAEPAHRSPYSPSSRLWFNAMHIEPREAFGQAATQAREALGIGEIMARLEADTLIDWKLAGGARLALLRQLFEQALASDPALIAAFEHFRAEHGEALEQHARFEALHAHFLNTHFQNPGVWSWRQWPGPYRDPRGPAVEQFAQAHALEVRFHAFLQWLAARGLDRAQQDARAAGMPIGLISDLAVGSDPNGSHVWSRQHETLVGVSIGAPPDALALQGQVWGLATLSPTAMRETGFSAFIELLRASMAHAGGVRIDHVMGLMRLWLVPEGASSMDGAYLAYPYEDLLRLVALESWRHRCLVIGEDLGTVPAGFGDTLAGSGVLGMGVLWFERDGQGRFKRPQEWRSRAIAMTTTHDLPTTAGWWLGRDIEVRQELGLIGSEAELAQQREERRADRDALWGTIHGDRHEPPPQPESAHTAGFVEAAVAHVGRTPAALAVVPLEDVLGLTDAPNVPGTSDEHPNWRRRLPIDLDTLLDSQPARQRLEALARARREAS